MRKALALWIIVFSLCAAPAALAEPPHQAGLSVVGHIPGPDGGWDYASFDPARRRVYVAHQNAVLTLDPDSGVLNPAFALGDHLHAVVPVPGTDLVVTTNSGDNSVRILKASDGTLVKSLTVAQDADGAVYDPATDLVVVVNGDAGLLTLIDPRRQATAGVILVGGDLEFAQVDGKGRAFVNVRSEGAIAVVDLAQRRVVGRYRMNGCVRPSGLAYVEGGRLISACANQTAKILDAGDGREIASLRIGGHPDSVLYDPQRRQAFIPTATDGALWVIALGGSADNTVIQAAPTKAGARTGAVDPKTGRIFLPTADFDPPEAAGERPHAKPHSFEILVMDRK